MHKEKPLSLQLTINDYLKTIKDNSLDGVFTFRLSPNKWDTPLTTKQIIPRLKKMSKNLKKMIAFEEGEDFGRVDRHYHVRATASFKSRESMKNLIFKHFKEIPDASGVRGGEKYSLRDCKAKDKTFWKSKTYVAKSGDIIFSKGYSQGQIANMIHWGKKLQDLSNKPSYEKIIILKNFQKDTRVEDVYDGIVEYYNEFHHGKIPIMPQMKRMMHNVLFKISPDYQDYFRNEIIEDLSLSIDSRKFYSQK